MYVPTFLQITFTTDEVIVPDVPGMFTSFQVKGSPLFVDPRLFDDPGHYAKIMGYDKPIDFKLNDDSAEKMNSAGKKDTA
jgi:transmembrane protein 70